MREITEYKIFRVTSFVDKGCEGNPAGVCLLPVDKTDDCLKKAAVEMNVPETAFIWQEQDNLNLRWFTSNGTEVDLCGHATLASAKILRYHNYCASDDTIHFHTKSGVLSANTDGEMITLDFPLEIITELPEQRRRLGSLLGVKPVFTGKTSFDYLIVVEGEETVRNLAPDFEKLAKVDTRGFIITAKSESAKHDFVSRFFAPAIGVNEDPVTGSAHCALGPYWSNVLNKTRLTGYQASKEGGVVSVSVTGNRVLLGGKAKEVNIPAVKMKRILSLLASTK